MSFLPNPFKSPEPFQMRLHIDQTDYWSLHFVDREIDKIGLMLVRMIINESDQEVLTNDSIVFRWVGSDQYGLSLNSRISAEVHENVLGDLDSQLHPISEAKRDLENLMVNLVKYELARKSSRSPYEPLTNFRDVDAPWCPELVVIPAGSFVMGSPDDEEERESSEGPQHRVRFARPFALGRYPVTFEEYYHFCIETRRERPRDQGLGRRPPTRDQRIVGRCAGLLCVAQRADGPSIPPAE
jgi:hypothetical protein